ncbi:pectinesterase family protein [Kineococcus glutinatus]|uniref:Fibronectin type-III domain-containing protein n=1 Tax=Kineococcus glutinatus TaxID=1070872 RepID=A0ABP9HZP9_9ACTN
MSSAFTPSGSTLRACTLRALPPFIALTLLAGPGAAAAAAADTTPPAPVAGVKTSADTSRVKLDWSSNKEKDLAGYLVYRAGSADGEFVRLTTTARSSSDYNDTTAPAGVPSYYRVTAVDKSGNESAPVAATATRKDKTAPAVPAALTGTRSDAGVVLDWADNAEADLAGYVVSRATGTSSSFAKLVTLTAGTSGYTDTTAAAGTDYRYRVSALDLSGNTSTAAAVAVVVPDTAAPAAVRKLTATASTTSVKLDWSSNGEDDLAGYLVDRAGSADGEFVRLTATPRTSSDFSDTTAPAGVPSWYRVTAVDEAGNESTPVVVSATRKDTTAPAAPGALTATGSAAGVVLDWADNAEADLSGYVVSRASRSGGSYTALTTLPAGTSTYTDTTAPTGAVSYYRVTARDASGNTSAVSSASATRTDDVAPAAVAGMKTSADTSRVKLDWSSGSEKDLAGYRVYRQNAEGGFDLLTTALVTGSEYSDTAAPAGVVSSYRVTAVDTSGNESAPVAASAIRRDTTAPAAPGALTATGTGSGVVLDWADSAEADVTGYVVSRASRSGGSYTTLTTVPVGTSTYTDTTAPAGTASWYRVTAIDLSGNTSTASGASAARVDDVAPAVPTGLVAVGGNSRVELSWSAVADADLAGYLVYRWPAGGSPLQREQLTAAPVSATAYADTTAASGTGYEYAVSAVDTSGNTSAASERVAATTADTTAPAAPAGLSGTRAAEGVVLDWADNGEADLAGYVVSRAEGLDGGTFSALTQAGTTASEFTDTTAATGQAYRYRISAVDAAGNTSAASDTLVVAAVVVRDPVAGADVTVAQDGSGDYTTITDALAAAPAGTAPFVVGIRPGTYRELLTVARSGVTLLGATPDASDVVITYDNAAGTAKPDGSGTYGTSGSATVLIKGNDVTTKNLTIENSFDEAAVVLAGGEQAVALKTTGDRLVFDNVRLLGDQDTLYADSPKAGALARSYYVNSYVEGDVDFVFGRGTAVFDRSTLHASSRGSSSNNGYVTAASTDRSLAYGFLVTDSTITSDAPAGTFSLGRPWQPSGDANAVAQVVVRDTELPAAVRSSPWTDMTSTFSWRDARFSEYQNTGAGAAVNGDRPQLTTAEAARYTKFTYLAGADGWNPTGEVPPADTTAPAAVGGLAAEAGDGSVALTWAAGTEADLAGYAVYRSAGEEVALTAANQVATALTGTSFTDRTAANGTTYRYVVTAVDRTGNESPASAVVTAAPVGVALPAHDVLVAADGSGQYTTVQAALDAVKAGTAARPTVIAVKPGVYKEMITVSKSYVTLIGTTGKAGDVVLTYDNAAGTTIPGTATTYGTGKSQSVLVSGSNVTVKDLTIENSFDEAAYTYSAEQAVALKTTGDRLVFDNVRLLGNQDTLLVDSPDANVVSRSYFVNSYVEGDVDFIFGRGTAVFDRSTIHALSRGSNSNNGYITAASTADKNPYGILITDSTITSNAPAGTFSLGRPWRGWSDGYTKNGVVYNSRGQVTIRNTSLPAAVRTTQPWADMSPNLWTDGRFSEYQNTGAGATQNDKRPQLTDEQAAGYTAQAYLAGGDGWNPVR